MFQPASEPHTGPVSQSGGRSTRVSPLILGLTRLDFRAPGTLPVPRYETQRGGRTCPLATLLRTLGGQAWPSREVGGTGFGCFSRTHASPPSRPCAKWRVQPEVMVGCARQGAMACEVMSQLHASTDDA